MAFGLSRRQAFLDAASPSEDGGHDDDLFARLVKLAEVLQSPASIKKALGDLATATAAHRNAADLAERAQRATQQELEQAQREHDERIARETTEHARVIASERAAADKDRQVTRAHREAAEADAKKAAELRGLWERKLAAVDATK